MSTADRSPARKRVLVTGATGLLGRELMRALADHEVLGLSRRADGLDLQPVDVRDRGAVQHVLRDVAPHVVLHAAGLRDVERIETDPELGFSINVDGARNVAEAAVRTGSWVLLISSDAVFAGTHPPYAVEAEPDPVSVYGRTKQEAERAVRALQPGAGILRLPLLYGHVAELNESSVTALAEPLLLGKTVFADDLVRRYPTYAVDAARVCRNLALSAVEALGGARTWHWSAPSPMTKFEMALAIADAIGQHRSLVQPSRTLSTRHRPLDSALASSAVPGPELRATRFEDGIRAVLEAFVPSP